SRLVEGVYEFEFVVTDSYGSQGRDNVIITVLPEPKPEPNKPPIANAGTEQTIILPTNSTTLHGSGKDPEGTTVTFQWNKISGPSSNIVSPTQPNTLVNQLVKGVYQFELTVKDSLGAESKARVIVTVYPESPKNVAPTADAGSDQSITLPDNSVTLNGSGTDIDGTITRFQWTFISGPSQPIVQSPRKPQTTVSNLDSGVYQFQLLVTDNENATGRDIITVTVNRTFIPPPVNNPPVAHASADLFNITLPVRSITLKGSGTDPDPNGFIKQFQWVKKSGPLPFAIASPLQAQSVVDSLMPGDYEFVLVVTDDQGATATDVVTITVNEPVIPPPPPNPLAIIFIGGMGIATIVSAFYFFFWLPFEKKVIVFFMHPEEEQLANSLMPNSTKTEGYRVGRCSREKINRMKKKGLAIHILNTTHLLINTPGNTQSYHYKFRKGKPTLKSTRNEPKPGVQIANLIPAKELKTAYDFPCFFIITLDTPLLPAFEQKLAGIGVQIIQHVPINSYILYVTEKAQLDKLHSEASDFIRLINHYSPRDTGLIVRTDHFEKAMQTDDQIILDLVLHREEDSAAVKSFLEQLKIFLIGSYRNRIRIRVPARTVLDFNLAANKFIQAIYEYIPPVLHNDIARQLVGIDTTDPFKIAVSETGDGEIIGVADTGIDRDHPDLKTQIIDATSWGRKETNDTSDPHGHGTHVTGSIVGNGTASGGKIKGMAPGAKVFFQSLLDKDGSLTNFDLQLHELFNQAYQKGARIHNNSWGADAEARYTIDATMVDEFIYEHPEMLIIISAGNEGIGNTRMASEKGYVGFESVG
ncbi:MAG TPA: S8 family serine peptidase, partial [Saprospiraceae bacterium]|nr:S8 family serine peptidase [Saprospiraceae bacterium]